MGMSHNYPFLRVNCRHARNPWWPTISFLHHYLLTLGTVLLGQNHLRLWARKGDFLSKRLHCRTKQYTLDVE